MLDKRYAGPMSLLFMFILGVFVWMLIDVRTTFNERWRCPEGHILATGAGLYTKGPTPVCLPYRAAEPVEVK